MNQNCEYENTNSTIRSGNIFRPPQRSQYNSNECNCKRQQYMSIHEELRFTHSQQEIYPLKHIVEPPSWSASAKGESHLEPVGETMNTHPSVDLTTRDWFYIGRSPTSDCPLYHFMSSRIHALIFHDPSGVCYITDCNSIHGTFVNGVKIMPYPHPPKRVRRGALLRFGGIGAPTFTLKSFALRIDDLIHNLGGIANSFTSKENSKVLCESPAEVNEGDDCQFSSFKVLNYSRRKRNLICHHSQRNFEENEAKQKDTKLIKQNFITCIRGDGGGVACIVEEKDAPIAALVLLNTRLNAIGQGGLHSLAKRDMTLEARRKFIYLLQASSSSFIPTSKTTYPSSRKRSRCWTPSPPKKILKKSIPIPVTLEKEGWEIPKIHCIHNIQNNESNVEFQSAKITPDKLFRRRKIRFFDEEPQELYSTSGAIVSFDNCETESHLSQNNL